MTTEKIKRFILKVPGSAFSPNKTLPVEKEGTLWIAKEISQLINLQYEPITVLGSSNLWSGRAAPEAGIGQVSSDMMGMLATIANALALRDALIEQHQDPRLFSSLKCEQAAAPYVRGKVLSAIQKQKAVVLAGGTGNPFFRADTAAALRACELNCKYILRATPKKELEYLKTQLGNNKTIDNILEKELLDSTAMAFCKENKTTIIFYESNIENSTLKALNFEGNILVVN